MPTTTPKKYPKKVRMTLAVSKKHVAELAARVIWALKFMDTPRGGGLVATPDGAGQDWVDYFCDALDGVGVVVDRKALRAKRWGKKKRVRPRMKDCGYCGGVGIPHGLGCPRCGHKGRTGRQGA